MIRGIESRLSSDSSDPRCPFCDNLLTSDAMNIKEGVALCPSCGKLSRLSDLNTSGRSISEILARPPDGCSISSDGHRVVATVSLRSWISFLTYTGVALFWNSMLSVFVLTAIAGLYTNLIGPLPQWFPAPGLNDGKPEMNGRPMELGMTLFLCLFLIPFVMIGIMMIGAAIMNLLGKVEVVIFEFDSYVATGVGPLRWKKRFDPREVRSVEYGMTAWQSNGNSLPLIEIKADRTVKFGSQMQDHRMEWLVMVLRQLLIHRSDAREEAPSPALEFLSRKSL